MPKKIHIMLSATLAMICLAPHLGPSQQAQLAQAAETAQATQTLSAPPFSEGLQQQLQALSSWSLVIKNLQTGAYSGYHADAWQLPSIPASTYKIPHSLIGLDSGAITLNTLFPWNGQPHEIAGWNQDHQLASAMRVSCVPCYQQVARKIGLERMRSYLKRLHYGQMDVQAGNLDSFWLTGQSQISPLQQLDFLQRLALRQLPIKQEVMLAVEQLIADPEWPGLYGKTGWGRVPHQGFGDSLPNQTHYGWYVGYLRLPGSGAQAEQPTYAFAARLIGKHPLPQGFAAARKQLVLETFQNMGLLPQSHP